MGYCTVVHAGDLIEIYRYQYELPKHITDKARVLYRKRSKKARDIVRDRRFDNLFRTRKKFVRLVRSQLRAVGSPSFFTFTCAEVVGIVQAYSYFTEFIKRLRRVFGKDFSYIVVPEFQKRGSVHFHALIWGLNEYVVVEREYRQFQNVWARGFLDCILTDGSPKLANYFSKYMLKTVRDKRLSGQKAFAVSSNVVRPVSINGSASVAYYEEVWPVEAGDFVEYAIFDTMWLGRCDYKKITLKKNENSSYKN